MGGSAMEDRKEVKKRRLSSEEYNEMADAVVARLRRSFEDGRRVDMIPSYRNKKTYGDLDVLVEISYDSRDFAAEVHDKVRRLFDPVLVVHQVNSDVITFSYRSFQIDLILTPKEEYEFAYTYFGFNDLGNLMGRIADKMGFKYGHDGLRLPMRDNTITNQFAEIIVSRDVPAVFAFLGYDHARYLQGFETLNDVFEFAASSPYFHRDIFLLHNRNAVSRIRDAKRPNYGAFLKWMENKPELDKYTWYLYPGDKLSEARNVETAYWLAKALTHFPDFAPRHALCLAKEEQRKALKAIWNGTIVGAATGFSGAKLGEFMTFCLTRIETSPDVVQSELTFADIFVNGATSPEWINHFILTCKAAWDESKGE